MQFSESCFVLEYSSARQRLKGDSIHMSCTVCGQRQKKKNFKGKGYIFLSSSEKVCGLIFSCIFSQFFCIAENLAFN